MPSVSKTINIVEENNVINVQDGSGVVKVIDSTETISFKDVTDTLNFEMSDVIIVNRDGELATALQKEVDIIDTLNSYVGLAGETVNATDNLWQIYKVERGEVDGVTCIFADGTEDFDKVWNERLTYTY